MSRGWRHTVGSLKHLAAAGRHQAVQHGDGAGHAGHLGVQQRVCQAVQERQDVVMLDSLAQDRGHGLAHGGQTQPGMAGS